MDVRSYEPRDLDALRAIFASNVPTFFGAVEEPSFEAFMAALPGPYFVVEHEGQVIGSGGYADARLTWLMFHRQWHGQGLGRFMLFYLMKQIGSQSITLGTTPNVVAFYEKFGFRVVSRTPDGFAPGYDRIEMIKKMDVCP
ncbi:MAG: GNAT family N-acetyltransferase [Acidobacteria bacterium]|nr:GNAT family N-acetyltransferase [Acidobacteriota bacterium]